MKVKLVHSMAGDRFSFKANQTIKCSDFSGSRLVAGGMAVEAAATAETDGELFDDAPAPPVAAAKRPMEKATRATPEAAVKAGAPQHCEGTTKKGNPCLRAPASGSRFCEQHAD